jgi:hypothetical protein
MVPPIEGVPNAAKVGLLTMARSTSLPETHCLLNKSKNGKPIKS